MNDTDFRHILANLRRNFDADLAQRHLFGTSIDRGDISNEFEHEGSLKVCVKFFATLPKKRDETRTIGERNPLSQFGRASSPFMPALAKARKKYLQRFILQIPNSRSLQVGKTNLKS